MTPALDVGSVRSVDENAHRIYPARLHISPALGARNRLTCAFRPILAIPHLLMVGGPVAFALSLRMVDGATRLEWAGAGALGAVAFLAALISWFAIVFGEQQPTGLRDLALYYLRWRVRAVAYLMLLRDEYPPFGNGVYDAGVILDPPPATRDRSSIAFRAILVLPHIVALWLLGIAWCIATLVAWFAILFTGAYPPALYEFSVATLRWNVRVESYVLLFHDAYPPFSLE